MKNLWLNLVLLGALFLFVPRASATENSLIVTDVSVSASSMSIVLNKQLEIRDIKVLDNKLTLPQGVEILSQELNDQILSAYHLGIPAQNVTSGSVSYRIGNYKTADTSSSVKAEVTLIFNDALSVNTSILGSDKGTRVSWPRGVTIMNILFRNIIERNLLKRIADGTVPR